MPVIKRVFFGTSLVTINDPIKNLILIQDPTLSLDVFQSAMNVSFHYLRPQIIYRIKEIQNIVILDYRQNVANLAKEAYESKDQSLWVKALRKPAILEINSLNGQTYIFIGHPRIGAKKREVAHKLEINVKETGKIPDRKFIFLKGESHSRKTISFVALYES